MKKYIILLLSLFSLTSYNQEITQEYFFGEPTIVQHENFITVEFDNTMQLGTQGNPLLPYFASSLLLPPGCEAVNVEFEYGKLTPLTTKGVLSPKQTVLPTGSANAEFVKNDDVYNSTGVYPEKSFGELITGFYKGHSIANIAFTPVVYIPAKQTISYYSSVKVKIICKHTEKAEKAYRLLKKDDAVKSMVDNEHAMQSYTYGAKSSDDYDMLMVSKQSYQQYFDTLTSLYRKYGIDAHFVSVESIYDEMQGADEQEQLRNFFIREYTEHAIEYLLLGGDVDVVPYRGFYCKVKSSSTVIDNGIPADIYYAGLDGSWNDNGDEKWAEIGEDDLYLELAVSRMPFGNVQELENMIHKIVQYQEHPVLGELNKTALYGEWLYNTPETWGSDFLNLLIGNHDDNGYETSGLPASAVIDSLYEEHEDFNYFTVLERISQAPSFIFHSGHASPTYLMTLSDSDIKSSNFTNNDGVNHNYTFVYTHGCDCGSFDYDDCIAEKMVLLNNFAVGGSFNSRFGWFNEGQTEGPSAHLNREFVDAIYHDKLNRYGLAQRESKNATVPWVNAPGQWEDGALRWCFYDCNALADPATQIWTNDPYNLIIQSKDSVFANDTTLFVKVRNASLNIDEANAVCVLVFDNNIIGKAMTDNNGECNITLNINELPEKTNVELYVSSYNTQAHKKIIHVDKTGDGMVEKHQTEKLIVFPNPFHETLNIKYNSDNADDITIRIIDINGKTVEEFAFDNTNVVVFNPTNINKGIYHVVVMNKGIMVERKKVVFE